MIFVKAGISEMKCTCSGLSFLISFHTPFLLLPEEGSIGSVTYWAILENLPICVFPAFAAPSPNQQKPGRIRLNNHLLFKQTPIDHNISEICVVLGLTYLG